MEKRKKKSRIKYIGGANEIRRNKSRRNKSRRNKSRRNKSRGGSFGSSLGRVNQNVSIRVTDGAKDYLKYNVSATEKTTIGDLKKSILEPANQVFNPVRLVFGQNCMLLSDNTTRLDDKDDNITLGTLDGIFSPYQITDGIKTMSGSLILLLLQKYE